MDKSTETQEAYKLRVEKVNGDVQVSYDNSVGFNVDKNANIIDLYIQ